MNCQERQYPTCYGMCEKYRAFRQELATIRENRDKDRENNNYSIDAVQRTKKRVRRKK